MPALLPAYKGIKKLPKSLRLPVRIQLIYLFLIPIVSTVFYDLEYETWTLWAFIFGIIIIMHLGFVLNNLKVHQSTIRQWWVVLVIPIETIVFGWWLKWDVVTGIVHLYIFEILGFCIGLFFGSLFRKANITAGHRITSIILAAFFIVAVYIRFKEVFDDYERTSDWVEYFGLIIPPVTASIPFIRTFISGKDGEDLNMGTSNLVENLKVVVAISALIYVITGIIMQSIN